ncbi:MAG: hypothetical protein K6C95_02670, partial [Lachnospiraceae bacterium]|nr:hypothetical protein [Lachnospiraceae bacterium]
MRGVVKNRKVMNVISVAIAAMIAATSFPSTVLAVDDARGTEIVEKAGEALEEETQDTAEEGGSA